ncbi:MAG: FAD-dependent oxidoreductase [Sphingobium sp.]
MAEAVREVVIVGAGIQGASLALSAVLRGLRPIVVDRDPVASGASVNSYGIIHGGLRYLQSLDIRRWRQSRRAQNWYVSRYARHIRPLRCVMPLYRGRARSPGLFSVARGFDRALRVMLGQPVPLPADGRCGRDEILQAYGVPPRGLLGGAIWYDAELTDAPALLDDMLQETWKAGGSVMRGWEVNRLEVDGGKVRGVGLSRGGERCFLPADMVIDCGGAWAGSCLGARRPDGLPTAATLAFNLLLDIPSPKGSDAYALSPDPGRGRSYFFRRHAEGTLVGTFYRPAPEIRSPEPSEQDIATALGLVRQCLPLLDIGPGAVRAVPAGLLPDRDGTGRHIATADRHIQPGPDGYHLVLGGKLTTAPLLSEAVASRLWPAQPASRAAH